MNKPCIWWLTTVTNRNGIVTTLHNTEAEVLACLVENFGPGSDDLAKYIDNLHATDSFVVIETGTCPVPN